MAPRKQGGKRTICLVLCSTSIIIIILLAVVIYLATQLKVSCEGESKSSEAMGITKEVFGKLGSDDIYRFTLKNGNNVEVRILSYGGIITNIFTPDRNGEFADIALGFDDLEGYKTNPPYLGALIGRYANRIAKGNFTLDGVTYQLAINNGPNALHGGIKGFDKRVWDHSIEGDKLTLTYVSEDMEENYPGELTANVTYQLTEDNKLVIEYSATTKKATVINLTNHAYFNLEGQASGNISNHMVQIMAEEYTPVNQDMIPTGVISPVDGTPLDLRQLSRLGDKIAAMPTEYGYDNNYVFGKTGWLSHMARVEDPTSGRSLDMYSTEPGVQFYTGFYLSDTGKGGTHYSKFSGFCLEAQHYPDSPNQPNFPTTVLRPGETYLQKTLYEFGVTKKYI